MVGDFWVEVKPSGPLHWYETGLEALVVTLSVKLVPSQTAPLAGLTPASTSGSGLTVMILLAVLEQKVGDVAVTV